MLPIVLKLLMSAKSIGSKLWLLLKTHWRGVVILLLAAAVWHYASAASSWEQRYSTEHSLVTSNKKAYEQAQQSAALANANEVAATESHWQEVVTKTKESYDAKLATAQSLTRAYAVRMRNSGQAVASPSSTVQVPQAAEPSSGAASPSEEALILVPESDLNVCAENTVKAESWLEFWNGLTSFGTTTGSTSASSASPQ